MRLLFVVASATAVLSVDRLIAYVLRGILTCAPPRGARNVPHLLCKVLHVLQRPDVQSTQTPWRYSTDESFTFPTFPSFSVMLSWCSKVPARFVLMKCPHIPVIFQSTGLSQMFWELHTRQKFVTYLLFGSRTTPASPAPPNPGLYFVNNPHPRFPPRSLTKYGSRVTKSLSEYPPQCRSHRGRCGSHSPLQADRQFPAAVAAA